MGEVIHGYELLDAFKTVDSGNARWCFARKESNHYFLKEFLSPVYPIAGLAMSEDRRSDLVRYCDTFEAKKQRLYAALRAIDNRNIVAAQDFFCECGRYYCVTEKVTVDPSLTSEQISLLPVAARILILMTLTHSMAQLESQRIVHADLKPTNVLLKPTTNGFYTLKLIDFDASFFEDEADSLDPVSLTGDPVYLAPEMFMAMVGEKVALTTKVDVFAMALLMHQFLCGKLPEFNHNIANYAYEVVLKGEELALDTRLKPAPKALLTRMLSKDPEDRPSFADIYEKIKSIPASTIITHVSSTKETSRSEWGDL